MRNIKNGFGSKGITAKFAAVMAVAGAMAGADVAVADKILYAKKKHPTNTAQPAEGLLASGSNSAWVCDNWKIKSSGGLSYIHPQDDAYWFELSGAFRFDETLFIGSAADKGANYPSGGNIRAAQIYMDGGVGKNWVYNLGLDFTGSGVGIDNAYLSYFGLVENNQIYVGKLSGNFFGLDSSNSTSWNPFLERSLQTLAFYPGDGLGVMTDFWWKDGGLTLSATQPDQTDTGAIGGARDRWLALARDTFSPVHEEGDVWHFGISAAHREVQHGASTAIAPISGVAFQAPPSARARNVKGSTSLINTTLGNSNSAIAANYMRLFNVEMARQWGPFMLETEYTHAFVHRTPTLNSTAPFLGSLGFHGWNLQTRYMLTGESHAYSVRDGNFGSIKPTGACGAVELAARYDYVNLNDKNVYGGSEHNATMGVNWYLNQQVRFSTNYIRANIRPAGNAVKRKLDIIGLRCQVRFY